MKFEYKVFNMSEVEKRNSVVTRMKKKITWLDLLNEYGRMGWELMFKLNTNSYLMKRGRDGHGGSDDTASEHNRVGGGPT